MYTCILFHTVIFESTMCKLLQNICTGMQTHICKHIIILRRYVSHSHSKYASDVHTHYVLLCHSPNYVLSRDQINKGCLHMIVFSFFSILFCNILLSYAHAYTVCSYHVYQMLNECAIYLSIYISVYLSIYLSI